MPVCMLGACVQRVPSMRVFSGSRPLPRACGRAATTVRQAQSLLPVVWFLGLGVHGGPPTHIYGVHCAGAGAVAWDERQYKRDYDALYRRELPYFKRARACGHCGAAGDPGDAAWFDFRCGSAPQPE